MKSYVVLNIRKLKILYQLLGMFLCVGEGLCPAFVEKSLSRLLEIYIYIYIYIYFFFFFFFFNLFIYFFNQTENKFDW